MDWNNLSEESKEILGKLLKAALIVIAVFSGCGVEIAIAYLLVKLLFRKSPKKKPEKKEE